MNHVWCALGRAAAAAALGLLSACGGGGGGDLPAAPTAPTAPTATISGNAVKGPVSGAAVRAFAVSGGVAGAQLGSAVTDAQGAFALPVAAHAGPVMLQMTGGSYVDEATGAPASLAPGEMMTAVLASLGDATSTVQLTPLTAMAQAMAAHLPGGMTAANIDAANAAVGTYFMVGDILHTRPMNPLVPGSASGASVPMMNYGMTLAAMAQYARDAGVPASAFVGSMMSDAADGVLDGRAGGAAIALGGGMMGGRMMQADAGQGGLAAAMSAFMAGASHRSGATTATFAPLTQHLTTGGGHMR